MQIANLAPVQSGTEAPPTAPTPRQAAAKALVSVPMGAMMVASMTAMSKQTDGQPASRAELLAPLFKQATPEQLTASLMSAIDGAIAAAPELQERSEALRQAAAGVVALLSEAAKDTVQGPADQSLSALATPLAEVAKPLFETAMLLDPKDRKEQPAQS